MRWATALKRRWAAVLKRRWAALRLTELIRRRTNFQRGLLYIGARRALMGGKWTPLDYFRRGEQGVWYEPSLENGTLFQDSAGTIPVTAVEQPVGLMLDKSGSGNHAYQTTATSRPVLSARVNKFAGTEALATQSITTLATAHTLKFEGSGSIVLTGSATGTYTAGTYNINCTAGTLVATIAGSVLKADLRETIANSIMPAYQRVNTATDYDTAGFPLYLRTDGIDDFMVTNAIDFTGTDKITIIAGIKNQIDQGYGFLCELSGNAELNPGSFAVLAPYGLPGVIGAFGGGTSISVVQASGYTAPINVVMSVTMNIEADLFSLGINSSESLVSQSDQGTGNLGNYPLYLFRHTGMMYAFNGNFYGLIIRGAETQEALLNLGQRYMAGKTGVVL